MLDAKLIPVRDRALKRLMVVLHAGWATAWTSIAGHLRNVKDKSVAVADAAERRMSERAIHLPIK